MYESQTQTKKKTKHVGAPRIATDYLGKKIKKEKLKVLKAWKDWQDLLICLAPVPREQPKGVAGRRDAHGKKIHRFQPMSRTSDVLMLTHLHQNTPLTAAKLWKKRSTKICFYIKSQLWGQDHSWQILWASSTWVLGQTCGFRIRHSAQKYSSFLSDK